MDIFSGILQLNLHVAQIIFAEGNKLTGLKHLSSQEPLPLFHEDPDKIFLGKEDSISFE